MNDIAKASGCSRATLYRYFENRDALYTAYVHREAHRVFAELGALETGSEARTPGELLVNGILASLHRVRESPALSRGSPRTGDRSAAIWPSAPR